MVLVLAGMCAVVLRPGAAGGDVRPGTGMAGVSLQMYRQEVRARLGRPGAVDEIKTVHGIRTFDRPVIRFTYRGGSLVVYFYRPPSRRPVARAFAIRTFSPGERLRGGIGVGSDERKLRERFPKLECRERSFGRVCRLGQNAMTDFAIRDGRIHSITVFYQPAREF